MRNKGMQLGAMLVVMLLMSMAFVPAVNANAVQDVDIATSIDCPCSQGEDLADCGCSGECDITTVQLSGSEANKAIE